MGSRSLSQRKTASNKGGLTARPVTKEGRTDAHSTRSLPPAGPGDTRARQPASWLPACYLAETRFPALLTHPTLTQLHLAQARPSRDSPALTLLVPSSPNPFSGEASGEPAGQGILARAAWGAGHPRRGRGSPKTSLMS